MTHTALTLAAMPDADRTVLRDKLIGAGWTPTDDPMILIQPSSEALPSE